MKLLPGPKMRPSHIMVRKNFTKQFKFNVNCSVVSIFIKKILTLRRINTRKLMISLFFDWQGLIIFHNCHVFCPQTVSSDYAAKQVCPFELDMFRQFVCGPGNADVFLSVLLFTVSNSRKYVCIPRLSNQQLCVFIIVSSPSNFKLTCLPKKFWIVQLLEETFNCCGCRVHRDWKVLDSDTENSNVANFVVFVHLWRRFHVLQAVFKKTFKTSGMTKHEEPLDHKRSSCRRVESKFQCCCFQSFHGRWWRNDKRQYRPLRITCLNFFFSGLPLIFFNGPCFVHNFSKWGAIGPSACFAFPIPAFIYCRNVTILMFTIFRHCVLVDTVITRLHSTKNISPYLKRNRKEIYFYAVIKLAVLRGAHMWTSTSKENLNNLF